MGEKKPSIGKSDNREVLIDVERLIETRMLVQANSGAGKSWALRRILEQTFGKVQHLVLDSEGEFATLREKYDYIVCAPHGADAVATPKTAGVLARRLLETRASAILDIYDLKAHERPRFIRLFLEALMNAPKKLWTPVIIVIDEAHMYCPEKGSAESLAAVIDLATRGRKRGYCVILATQRLSKLHKDAAAEMINKLIGRTGLDVDVRRAADELGFNTKEAMMTLRQLKPGEFHAFGAAISETVTKVKIGAVKTTHPKVGSRGLTKPPPPSAKIKKTLSKLADLAVEAEKEAKTIADYKTQNADLKRKLTLAEKQRPAGGISETEVERRLNLEVSRAKKEVEAHSTKHIKALRSREAALQKTIEQAKGILSKAGVAPPELPLMRVPVETSVARRRGRGPAIHSPSLPTKNLEGLKSGAIRILKELAARCPAGYTKPQVGALTRFKHTGGTFGKYMSNLRQRGLIELQGNLIFATQGALEELGDGVPETPTTHEEIMAMWQKALKKGAYEILEVIVAAEEGGIEKEEIAEAVNKVVTGGTFGSYLSVLRSNGLVTQSGGIFIANDILYPEGK